MALKVTSGSIDPFTGKKVSSGYTVGGKTFYSKNLAEKYAKQQDTGTSTAPKSITPSNGDTLTIIDKNTGKVVKKGSTSSSSNTGVPSVTGGGELQKITPEIAAKILGTTEGTQKVTSATGRLVRTEQTIGGVQTVRPEQEWFKPKLLYQTPSQAPTSNPSVFNKLNNGVNYQGRDPYAPVMPGQKEYENPPVKYVPKQPSGVQSPILSSSDKIKDRQRYNVNLVNGTEIVKDTKNNLIYTSTGKDNLFFDDKYDVYKFEDNAFVKASRQEVLGFAKDFAQESASKTLVLGQSPINLGATVVSKGILSKTLGKAQDYLYGKKTFSETKLLSTRVGKSIATKGKQMYKESGALIITEEKPLTVTVGKARAVISQTEIGTGILNKGKIYLTTTKVSPVTFKLKSAELVSIENILKPKKVLGINGTAVKGIKAFTSEPLSLERAGTLAKDSFFRVTGKVNVGGKYYNINQVVGSKLKAGNIKTLLSGEFNKEKVSVFSELLDYEIKSRTGKSIGSTVVSSKSVEKFLGETPSKFYGKLGQSETTSASRSIVRSNLVSSYYEGVKNRAKDLLAKPKVVFNRGNVSSSLNDLFKKPEIKLGSDLIKSVSSPTVEVSSGGGLKQLQVQSVKSVSKSVTQSLLRADVASKSAVSKVVAKSQLVKFSPSVVAVPKQAFNVGVNVFKPKLSFASFADQQGVFSKFSNVNSMLGSQVSERGLVSQTKSLGLKTQVRDTVLSRTVALSKVETAPKVDVLSKTKTRTRYRSLTIEGSASKLGEGLKVSQDLGLSQGLKLNQSLSLSQGLSLSQSLQQQQLLRQKQLLKQQQLLKQNVRVPSFRPNFVVPRIPVLLPKFGFKSVRFSTSSLKPGKLGRVFDVVSRVKGKKIVLARGVTRNVALGIGKKFTGFTTARSFKIKPVGFSQKSDIGKVDLTQYRLPKLGGRVSKEGFTFVEKSKFAIDTLSEASQLREGKRFKAKL